MSQMIVSESPPASIDDATDLSQVTQFPPTTSGDVAAFTLRSPVVLEALLDEWADLSRNSSSPNSFYEPAFFLAATSRDEGQSEWQIVVVTNTKTKELVGFFPFVETKRFGVLRTLSLWKSELSYLTVPLIKAGYESQVLECMQLHVRTMQPKVDVIEFPLTLAEGRVHQEIHDVIRDQLLTAFQFDHYARAAVTKGRDYESYVKDSVGGHHLRGYKRQLRNLNKLGQVEFRVGTDVKSAGCWSRWFLDLEAEGWKGREGTAMKQHPEQASFFADLVATGMQRESLEMIGLFLNGEPIALGCTLLSGEGGFTYKIAFNEDYKKYSPGILLQLHITERLLSSEQFKWLDSCAIPNHPMINRLWQERISIEHLLISTGRPLSNLLLGALPLLRVGKRLIRKPKR